MDTKKLATPLISAIALLAGLGAGIAGIAGAQTATVAATTTTTNSSTSDPTDAPHQGHAPLGGDGNITSINGTTITLSEENNEGGASYTIDASKATVTKAGATAQLSDLKVGDKIFVQGSVSGTSVAATSISDGPHGMRGMGHGGPDTDATSTTQ